MNNHKLTGLSNGINSGDSVNYGQLTSAISGISVSTNSFSSDVNANNHKINNL